MFLLFVVYFSPQFGFFSVVLSVCFLVSFPLFYINRVRHFYMNVKKIYLLDMSLLNMYYILVYIQHLLTAPTLLILAPMQNLL